MGFQAIENSVIASSDRRLAMVGSCGRHRRQAGTCLNPRQLVKRLHLVIVKATRRGDPSSISAMGHTVPQAKPSVNVRCFIPVDILPASGYGFVTAMTEPLEPTARWISQRMNAARDQAAAGLRAGQPGVVLAEQLSS